MAWGLRRISSRELTAWRAFFSVEPMPEARADMRMAVLAALIANANRDPKRKPFSIQDFLPSYWTTTAEETDEERVKRLLAKVAVLNAAFGGEDKRNR